MYRTCQSLFLSSLVAFALACGGSQAAPSTPPASDDQIVPPPTAAPVLPKAEVVLDRFVEVTGGADAYLAGKTSKATGTLEIVGQGMKGTVVAVVDGDKLLLAMTLGAVGSFNYGSDGTTLWSKDPMTGARIITGVEKSQFLRSADPLAAVRWRDNFKSYELTGTEDVGGKPAYVISLVDVDDIPETHYYDVTSGLLVKSKGLSKTQMGDTPTETVYTDYTKFGDVTLASKVTASQGATTFEIVNSEVEMNPTIDPSIFALPAEIVQIRDAQK